jgi:hypothetical protein
MITAPDVSGEPGQAPARQIPEQPDGRDREQRGHHDPALGVVQQAPAEPVDPERPVCAGNVPTGGLSRAWMSGPGNSK